MSEKDCFVTEKVCTERHKEVANLKDWISKIDNRFWMVGMGLVLNLVGVVITLIVIIAK